MTIHSIMGKKGYRYFDGVTNDRDNGLFIDFSTGHNGRGDAVELEIFPDYTNVKTHVAKTSKEGEYMERTEYEKVNDAELVKILNSL